jgi:hypothetical protein
MSKVFRDSSALLIFTGFIPAAAMILLQVTAALRGGKN